MGLFAGVFAVIAALGGLAQINPIWLYGPFEPSAVTTASQPDWYMGWIEGALRLFPAWRFHLFGYTISEVFLPAVVLPGITFGLLYAWPFLEARVTRDRVDHHLLDRPRYRPVRTAIGVGTLTFYVVLFVAGAQDIFAQKLGLPVPTVTWTLRVHGLRPTARSPPSWPPSCATTWSGRRRSRRRRRRSATRARGDDDLPPPPPPPPPRKSSALRTAGLVLAAAVGWLVDRLRGRRRVR